MNDRKQIEKKIQTYVNGMEELDGDKTTEVFADCAVVVGHLNGELNDMMPEDFSELVEKFPVYTSCTRETGSNGKMRDVDFEIVACEIEGLTATVRVKFKCLGISYVDTLAFIKEEGEWKIFHRLFAITNPYNKEGGYEPVPDLHLA